MSHHVNWHNPYAQRTGRWLRGNLHTHTTNSDGELSPEETVNAYAQAGYDFLALSDHMFYTTVPHPRLTLLPGMEWNDVDLGKHTGLYGSHIAGNPALSKFHHQEGVIAALGDDDDLVILNHPNWQYRPHYHREELLLAGAYDGVEIFNGVVKRLEGSEYATDKWDYLLAKGKRVLGFANDDAHLANEIALGWIMVRAEENSAQQIFAAIQSGNFYSSTGVVITDIRRDGQQIELETENAQEIQIIGEGGALLRTTRDAGLTFNLSDAGHSSYVRFTAYGQGSSMAWTQPFFLR